MFSVDILLAGIVFLLIGIPSVLLFLELVLGQTAPKSSFVNIKRDGCCILIPAHNEELIIGKTLAKLNNEVSNLDRILVVADNCTDSTVAICKEYNIEVIQRIEQTQIGKGHALDFGIRYFLKNTTLKTVVIFDADCVFKPGSLDTLVKRCQFEDKIVQSTYLMKAASNSDVKTRLAEFGWLVKNKIRPTGRARLGINCQLQGSGMAFPRAVFDKISLASSSIVEDLELSLKLTNIGEEVIFETNAVVTSTFPTSIEGAVTQRTRWEHGHLSTISRSPKLMYQALLKKRFNVFWLILDASIPPTILWLLFVFGCAVISSVFLLFSIYLPFVIFLCCFIFLAMGIFISWLINARQLIQFKDILGVLGYILSKFSIYSAFITFRQKNWVRTKRNK